MQLFTLKNASISRAHNLDNANHVAAHAYATTKRTSWYPAFGPAATWRLIG
ncbi:MAG: hypothetical protein NTX12_03080 [Actinobacteria bacterium]|nr:hypothetical protein [Actinomycetota bacterium]